MIKASNELLEVWKYLPLIDLETEISNLDKVEKILLYLLTSDRYSMPNENVVKNIEYIKDIEKIIISFNLEETMSEEDTEIFDELKIKTGSNFIDSDKIVDNDGNRLKDPPKENEIPKLIREIKIKKILS